MINNTKYCLDSNILIYYLSWHANVDEFFGAWEINISIISEIEVLWYHKHTKETINNTQTLLSTMQILWVTEAIKSKAIFLRQVYNIKLADSIIWATARKLNVPLITSDKIFERVDEIEMILHTP